MQNSASYAVLIVNYNTAAFTMEAVKSVLRSALSDNFIVSIVDNASRQSDLHLLETLSYPNVHLLPLKCNSGYARGNNAAAQYAEHAFRPEFLVVMNPDVELTTSGSIETLIDTAQRGGADAVGTQPLINNYRLPGAPDQLPAIRRVPDFWDLLVSESIFLRYIFTARFKRFRMEDARPYGRHTKFFVPSGAFFIIRADTFKSIGGFDENTFLFGEELILGKKLESQRKHFVFEPSVTVQHYHAAATGYDRWRPNRRMFNFARQSQIYYARAYLGTGRIKQAGLFVAIEIGYWIRCAASVILNIRRMIRLRPFG